MVLSFFYNTFRFLLLVFAFILSSTMYHSYASYQHPRPRSRGSYFWPFVSIIILGLIAVFVFQIVEYFYAKREKALENKAAVQIVAGKAEMRIWGIEQWMNALDGSILNEGDAIRTAPGSRVALSLLNGSVVRLSSETEIELAGLKSRDAHDEISVNLKKGEVWLNRTPEMGVRTAFSVSTPNLEARSLGTAFDVENTGKQAVRVLNGKVQVVVQVQDLDTAEGKHMRAVETIDVALGQEISLGVNEINDLENNKPLDLLAVLADDFRDNDWYKWNRAQDASGKVSVSVADAVAKQAEIAAESGRPKEEEEKPPVEIVAALSAPEILAPKENERLTRASNVLISGKTAEGTEKIEATTYIGGKPESYVLQRYKPGSSNWSYVVSSEYANLVPGPNRYSIVAIGKDGKRSDPAEITIIYDKPKEPADLSAPKVLSFNKSDVSETTEDLVIVEGKIGKGIVKVFVNEFALTRYVPDSGKWSYYANAKYGNLKEGVNEYSVYGVDADGNKTPAAKFTITKKPKPVEQPVETPAATPPTAGSPSQPEPAETPTQPSEPTPPL